MSFDICNDGHDEICYEGSSILRSVKCPLCEAIKYNKDLEEENSSLSSQVQEMEKQIP